MNVFMLVHLCTVAVVVDSSCLYSMSTHQHLLFTQAWWLAGVQVGHLTSMVWRYTYILAFSESEFPPTAQNHVLPPLLGLKSW